MKILNGKNYNNWGQSNLAISDIAASWRFRPQISPSCVEDRGLFMGPPCQMASHSVEQLYQGAWVWQTTYRWTDNAMVTCVATGGIAFSDAVSNMWLAHFSDHPVCRRHLACFQECIYGCSVKLTSCLQTQDPAPRRPSTTRSTWKNAMNFGVKVGHATMPSTEIL